MSVIEDRVFVGHLSDGDVASRIVTLLIQEGIVGPHVSFDSMHKRYVLTISRQEDLSRATNIYRHSLGLPALAEPSAEPPQALPLGRVTLVLMVVSTLIWIVFQFKLFPQFIDLLYMASRYAEGLEEIAKGEVWRLVTPMLLHFNFLHILFNMMCLIQFGSIQENLLGKRAFIAFVLLSSLASNIFQYLASGPGFGGMSGVIFAQIGFLWCHKKCDQNFSHGLPKDVVATAGIWFLLCLSGIFFFRMANVAHGVGAVTGILLALVWNACRNIRPPLRLPLGTATAILALTYGAEYWLNK